MRALIVALTLFLSGCGQSEESVEFKDSEGNTRSVEVIDEGDTRTVKSDDGLMTTVGTQDEDKAKFPDYAPRYTGSKVVSVVDLDMGGMKRQMITQHSADAAETVLAFDKSEFAKAGVTVTEMPSGTGGTGLSEGPLHRPGVQVFITPTATGATIDLSVPTN